MYTKERKKKKSKTKIQRINLYVIVTLKTSHAKEKVEVVKWDAIIINQVK